MRQKGKYNHTGDIIPKDEKSEEKSHDHLYRH